MRKEPKDGGEKEPKDGGEKTASLFNKGESW